MPVINPLLDDRPAILHVVNTLDGGGTERTLVRLLQELDHGRIRHVLVTFRGAGALAAQLPDSVACAALEVHGRSRSAGIRLRRLARYWRAAAIHARNTGCWADAVIAGALCGARVILGFHGLEAPGRFSTRLRWITGAASALGARFTAVSGAGQRKLEEELGVASERVAWLPNGVDLGRFSIGHEEAGRTARAALGVPAAACVVGTVGSLTAVKQPGSLLDAFAEAAGRLPELHLLIVGSGPLRQRLEEQIDALRLTKRVHFAGQREDVPQLLAAMDVYVCFSAAEGTSNALLEALAAGRPVVTSDVGDHAAIVGRNEAGLVLGQPTVAALARSIALLVEDPQRRRRMAESARRRAADYSIERTVQAYEAYYGSLCNALHNGGSVPRVRHQAACAAF